MAGLSRIEWTEATWHPVTGCTAVSPGCDRCYAEALTRRFAGVAGHPFTTGFTPTTHPGRLHQPLRWHQPRRVFVAALGDLFHHAVSDRFIAQVWAVMYTAHWHSFQVLTKRHTRLRTLLSDEKFRELVGAEVATLARDGIDVVAGPNPDQQWPAPNVWVGVSAETQQWADIRLPALLGTPAALRWVSCEPLLGPVDLYAYLRPTPCPAGCGCRYPLDPDASECGCDGPCGTGQDWPGPAGVGWVVVGGESGPGARPVAAEWVDDLVDQCDWAEVPVFVKQLGTAWARTQKHPGRGGDPTAWPPQLRVRQYPTQPSTRECR